MPAYQHVSRLFGGFDTSVVQIDGRAASAIYVSLRCATPHCSFHTTSSLPQPTSETSHISTCTACHRTCTTSVASDAFFCSWIVTMSLFDWLSFCQGLDLGGLLPPQALTGTYLLSHRKVPRHNVPDKVPRPQTLRPRSYSLVIRPPVRLPLALPWSAYIRIDRIFSSILQSFFSNRLTTNLEYGYPHCRFKTNRTFRAAAAAAAATTTTATTTTTTTRTADACPAC